MWRKATDCHIVLGMIWKINCLATDLNVSFPILTTSRKCSRNQSPNHLPVFSFQILPGFEV